LPSKSQLIEEEKKKKLLDEFYSRLDYDVLRTTAETISMLARGVEGKAIEPEDIITRLTNVKNILERTRFPTYPLLAKHVFLRLIALYNPNAYACKDWSDIEAEALISYKGLGREEYVEMTRSATTPEQEFYIGEIPRGQEVKPAKKRRWWQRMFGKKEESEFIYE